MELARRRGGEVVRWLGNEEGRGVREFWGGGDGAVEGVGEEGQEEGEEVMLLDDDNDDDYAQRDLWVDEEREGYVLREEEGYEDGVDGGREGRGMQGGYGGTRQGEEGFEEIDRLLEMGR